MFSYLRYFSIFSFILVLIAAYFVGAYFKAVASEDLRELVEKDTEALAQGYINSVWKTEYNVLENLYMQDIKEWQNYSDFVLFANKTRNYFKDIPVVEFMLYTPQGEYILSKYDKNAGSRQFRDKGAYISLRKTGEPLSEILWNQEFSQTNGEITNGTLVRVYVPIVPDERIKVIIDQDVKALEGIIELYYDVSPQWRKLQNFHLISMLGIVVIFLILIAVSYTHLTLPTTSRV